VFQGTALPAKYELFVNYRLPVYVVPPHRAMQRIDTEMQVYPDRLSKFKVRFNAGFALMLRGYHTLGLLWPAFSKVALESVKQWSGGGVVLYLPCCCDPLY
jgi:hypothetical protein